MLFVVSGPSCVGKSYSVSQLCRYYNFSTIIPFTSRSPRSSESEGAHYHFRSKEDIKKISKDFIVGYWSQPFGDDWYGYTNRVDLVVKDKHNWIIHSTTDIALKIKESNSEVKLIFLDFNSAEIMLQKIKARFSKSPDDIENRLKHAEYEKSNADKFDYIIKADSIDKILEQLINYIESIKGKLAYSDFGTGVLSDSEIIDLLNSRDSFNIVSPINDNIIDSVKGCTVDLTLSPKVYIPKRRGISIFKKVFDIAKGDKNIVNNLFQERELDFKKGLILFPKEFMLASTNEKITLSPDIVGFLTGRSSFSRLGISIELSQNLIQPGHDDVVPLQIKNNLPFPIRIYPNVKIVQVFFIRMNRNSHLPYNINSGSKYLGSNRDIKSKYYEDPIFNTIKTIKEKNTKISYSGVSDIFQIVFGLASIVISFVLPTVTNEKEIFYWKVALIVSGVLFFSSLIAKYMIRRLSRY